MAKIVVDAVLSVADLARKDMNFEHIKSHYYGSHGTINPTRVVPLGPVLDLDAAHGRDGVEI